MDVPAEVQAMTKHFTVEDKLTQPVRSQESVRAAPSCARKRGERVRVSGNNLSAKATRDRVLLFGSLDIRQPGIAGRLPWFVLCVSGLYLVSGLLYPFFGLKKIDLPEPAARAAQEFPRPTREPFEKYLKDVSARRLFSAVQTQGETPATAEPAGPELLPNLSVVGIISGEKTQVVIEDTARQKTYYAVKGQVINDFQIEDIQPSKVILKYKGKRYELSL